MAITATYIGQSTVQVSTSWTAGAGLAGRTSFMTFAQTVADAITGTQPSANGTLSGTAFTNSSGTTVQSSSGWTLIDSFWGGCNTSAEDTASPVYNQVFRSLNEDGVTYKNIILKYHTVKGVIQTSCCEWWGQSQANYNLATPAAITNHTPTNECHTFNDCAPVSYNTTLCDFIVMVSPRWIFIHSYINNEPSMWAGVVEMQREDPNDTATLANPNWGWVSSTLWALNTQGPGATTTGPLQSGSSFTLICVPRTKYNETGKTAAINWAADYGITAYPNFAGATIPFTNILGSGGTNRFATSGWDSSKRLAMSIKPIYQYKGDTVPPVNYGIMNGLKLLSPVGANMNKINIPVDANGNNSTSGTDRPHWLLNTHSKASYIGTPASATTEQTAYFANGLWTSTSVVTGYNRPVCMISIGAAYYSISTTGQIVRTDATTKASILLATASATGFQTMVYDGERFIYANAGNNITVIDTVLDNVATSYTPVATLKTTCLAINGTMVISADNVTGTTSQNFRRYNRIAFSATGTITLTVAATLPVVANSLMPDATASMVSLENTYDGDVIGQVYCANVTTSGYIRILKLTAAGVLSTLTSATASSASQTAYSGSIITHSQDRVDIFQYNQNVNGTFPFIISVNPRTGSGTANSSFSVSSVYTTTLATTATVTLIKIQGVIMACCTNPNGLISILWNSYDQVNFPYQAITPDWSTYDGAVRTNGLQGNFMYSDGCKIFFPTSTGFKIWNNINGGTNVGGNTATNVTLGQVAIPA